MPRPYESGVSRSPGTVRHSSGQGAWIFGRQRGQGRKCEDKLRYDAGCSEREVIYANKAPRHCVCTGKKEPTVWNKEGSVMRGVYACIACSPESRLYLLL